MVGFTSYRGVSNHIAYVQALSGPEEQQVMVGLGMEQT